MYIHISINSFTFYFNIILQIIYKLNISRTDALSVPQKRIQHEASFYVFLIHVSKQSLNCNDVYVIYGQGLTF